MPAEWRDGVPAAAIPDNAPVTLGVPLTGALVGAIVTPWVVAYLTTDSALEKANQRTRRTIEIVTQCEALANAARP